MAKEVILLEDVPGLGDTGEVVRVADGYARNFLLPRNLAAPVTEVTRRMIDKKRQEAEARRAAAREKAAELAKLIESTPLTIRVKVGDGDKLYGSVTAADLIDHAKTAGLTLDKRQVLLTDPIRELGSHKVAIKLAGDVKATLVANLVKD